MTTASVAANAADETVALAAACTHTAAPVVIALCAEAAAVSVPADYDECRWVTGGSDAAFQAACEAVMTVNDPTVSACTYTPPPDFDEFEMTVSADVQTFLGSAKLEENCQTWVKLTGKHQI